MQRGNPAGQVAKGGSEAPCFYSRRVSAWVSILICLDLGVSHLSRESSARRTVTTASHAFYINFQYLVIWIYWAPTIDLLAFVFNLYLFTCLRFTLFYFYVCQLVVEAYDHS